MKVLKFGGSSVAEADRIVHLSRIIELRHRRGEQLCLVFSALGGVTDQLISISHDASKGKESYRDLLEKLKKRHLDIVHGILAGDAAQSVSLSVSENFNELFNLLTGVFLVREASPRTMDYILSFGERNSASIIAAYFNFLGIPSIYVDARKIIKTNKEFGRAQVNFSLTNQLIQQHFADYPDVISVITGYIASDVGGLTTTLGRGGSDYSAAIVAGALKAESLEIWTDVDGVLTSNPRIVKNAYTIPKLSYDEAMELSHFGAKVIYPPTIQPALSEKVPIFIKNTFNPDFEGTYIGQHVVRSDKRKITGVTSISDISLLTLEGSGLIGKPGTAARLFSCLGRNKINVIMITQASSEHSICFAVSTAETSTAMNALNEEFNKELEADHINPIKSETALSLIAVIGENMKHVPGVAGSLFKALGQNGINVIAIAQGSSELNITFAIQRSEEHKALNLVHDVFFLSENKRINVYLVGVGLIGTTLLQQIMDQHQTLLEEKHLDVRVIGIANSRKMVFDRNGIDLKNWKSLLNDGSESGFRGILSSIKELNLPNSVFVDCTANIKIKDIYPDILNQNISISTANKVAASSSYAEFENLKMLALKNNVQYLFETNVGAGLPVLSTLSGLVESGDEVQEIEAVISGSISYIFNNYVPGRPFKELIEEARELGFTEPDPRDDLSGQDIKRKIVILSRVAGYAIEPEDVEVDPILPALCMKAESIDDFFVELDRHDDYFGQLIKTAQERNAKLRYIASFSDKKARIKLVHVTSESPFYNLSSSDNMIVFRTARYKERPLIIQGPGAGSGVTAAGVFAEIIQLGNVIV